MGYRAYTQQPPDRGHGREHVGAPGGPFVFVDLGLGSFAEAFLALMADDARRGFNEAYARMLGFGLPRLDRAMPRGELHVIDARGVVQGKIVGFHPTKILSDE